MQQNRVDVRWFGGADFVSRAPITGLGADGALFPSWITFGVGSVIAPVYKWRSEAGDTLMKTGFDNFKNIYNNSSQDPSKWDINQLKSEQSVLQPIHEKYLSEKYIFNSVSSYFTDSKSLTNNLVNSNQTQTGGVNILDYNSRIRFGCKLLGRSGEEGC